jgi:hypothetical protein
MRRTLEVDIFTSNSGSEWKKVASGLWVRAKGQGEGLHLAGENIPELVQKDLTNIEIGDETESGHSETQLGDTRYRMIFQSGASKRYPEPGDHDEFDGEL